MIDANLLIGMFLGGLIVAIVYTFRPALAVVPSGWLKTAWAAISRRSPKE